MPGRGPYRRPVGEPFISHLGLDKEKAMDHARQAREMVRQFARVRVFARSLSVAPIQALAFVVVVWPVAGSAAKQAGK